jgi:anti-anti-sigma factor
MRRSFVGIDGVEHSSTGSTRGGGPQLGLELHDAGARRTLVLTGELDMACAPVLDSTLRRICSDRTEAITLDLSGLTFMDSTGLRTVLLAKELCEQHDCEFMLTPGSPQIQRLFEVTGLVERLPFQAA